jgi:hypothetical protein
MNINQIVPTITFDICTNVRNDALRKSDISLEIERIAKDDILLPTWTICYFKHVSRYKSLIKKSSKTF